MLTPKISHAKSCLYCCYLISHKCHFLLPTSSYLTAHQPAKRAILTRSSFIAYRTSLGLSGGCEHYPTFEFKTFTLSNYLKDASRADLILDVNGWLGHWVFTSKLYNFDLSIFFTLKAFLWGFLVLNCRTYFWKSFRTYPNKIY